MKRLLICFTALLIISCGSPKVKKEKEKEKDTVVMPVATKTVSLAELEDSLVKMYKIEWDRIVLQKEGTVPLYGDYRDSLQSLLNDISSVTQGNEKGLPKVEKLRLKLVKGRKWEEACENYSLYGQPYSNSDLEVPCEGVLQKTLNDPSSLEIVGYKVIGQVRKGWKVMAKYRANNVFGAKILKASTFILQYNVSTKVFVVVDMY